MATNSKPTRTWATRIDWLFTKATLLAAAALALFVLLFVLDGIWPGLAAQDFGFSSIGQGLFSLALVFSVAIMALLPLVSLPYMISGILSDNTFDSKGLLLTSIAVLSSGFALIFSIDSTVCARVAGLGGNCAPYQLAYVFDQFSKGGFADIFDIYDMKLSAIATSELNGLAKFYTLNFRMISAIYIAMIALSLYRRFFAKEAK